MAFRNERSKLSLKKKEVGKMFCSLDSGSVHVLMCLLYKCYRCLVLIALDSSFICSERLITYTKCVL